MKDNRVFWSASTLPAGFVDKTPPPLDEFKKLISSPNFVGDPSDMKAYPWPHPIVYVVNGYEVLHLKDIKLGWVRANDATGNEVGFMTVSGTLTTDRMFIDQGGNLIVATNGKDGANVAMWDAGSIANYKDCGLRNAPFTRQTSFDPRFFDVIEPNQTNLFPALASFTLC